MNMYYYRQYLVTDSQTLNTNGPDNKQRWHIKTTHKCLISISTTGYLAGVKLFQKFIDIWFEFMTIQTPPFAWRQTNKLFHYEHYLQDSLHFRYKIEPREEPFDSRKSLKHCREELKYLQGKDNHKPLFAQIFTFRI